MVELGMRSDLSQGPLGDAPGSLRRLVPIKRGSPGSRVQLGQQLHHRPHHTHHRPEDKRLRCLLLLRRVRGPILCVCLSPCARD
jgi:hypothetical protein